ncbi:hypothetical protein ACWCQL_23420 [Streptomyces sp. NPDC002073]
MTQGGKIAVVVAAVAGIASTPLIWLLDGPDAGQLVGATVQGATGIAALVWALLQQPAPATPAPAGPVDTAEDTGRAAASGTGSRANTGIRRPGGTGPGSAAAKNTGEATAENGGYSNTGIDYGN